MTRRDTSDSIGSSSRLRGLDIYPNKRRAVDGKRPIRAGSSRMRKAPPVSAKKPPQKPKTKKSRAGLGMFVFIFGLAVLALILVGNAMWSAEVALVPTTLSASVSDTYEARINDPGADFNFEVMVISDSMQSDVLAGERQFVEEVASGQIVVFNEESSRQRLLEETRFQSSEGKIYKLGKGEDIYVPAGTADKPGSIEVTVYAEKPGPDYNVEATDFTIPGWREQRDDRFETQYARSKGPIDGGFSGYRSVVKDESLEATGKYLSTEVKDLLVRQVVKHVSGDKFSVFDESFFEIEDPVVVSSDDDSETGDARVSVTGSLSLVVFDRDDFEQNLAAKLIEGGSDSKVTVENLQELNIFIKSMNAKQLADATSIEITAEGEPLFVWDVPVGEIKESLVDIKKQEFPSVLESQTAVEQGVLKIKPFWKSKTPRLAEDISVELVR